MSSSPLPSQPDSIRKLARDPAWLPHRYDPVHDAFHLVRLSREDHDRATFITDEYLPADRPRRVVSRDEIVAGAPEPVPLHLILHSAYCCSTLLARACDLPGIATALKEPVVLNDLVGWRRRGGEPRQIGAVLDGALRLLARPFQPGESVIVKPSNVVNGLGVGILAIRPQMHALLLHAPLRTYLASIAKKGMWGRLWARELFIGLHGEGLVRLGFDTAQLLGQTDLQIAAVGWLAQHVLFAELVARYGAQRVRTLDSETLTARPGETIAALATLFGLPLDTAAINQIIAGPAFTRHSKSGAEFGQADRAEEHLATSNLHAEEIDKVAIWAEAVAQSAGIAITLDAPLLV